MKDPELLNRLFKGYYFIKVRNHRLKVKPLTLSIENKASVYHDKIIEDLKFEDGQDWLDDKKRMIILGLQDLWNPEKQKDMDIALQNITKLKIELFKHFTLVDTRKLIKSKIKDMEEIVNTLHQEKYIYYEYTKESYANILKNRYIIKNTVYLNNRLFFKTEKKQQLYYLERISKLFKILEGYLITNLGKIFGKAQKPMRLTNRSKTAILSKEC